MSRKPNTFSGTILLSFVPYSLQAGIVGATTIPIAWKFAENWKLKIKFNNIESFIFLRFYARQIRFANTRDFRINLHANNISLKRKNNSLLPRNSKFFFKY